MRRSKTAGSGQQRRIEPVNNESGLPPIADELLRHGER